MTKSGQPPKSFTTETRVVRKNRSAGVSPASEPRQLLLGQHDLCRLEAGDTFFLTTTKFTAARRIPFGCNLARIFAPGSAGIPFTTKTRRREEILCDSSRLRV